MTQEKRPYQAARPPSGGSPHLVAAWVDDELRLILTHTRNEEAISGPTSLP